MAGSEPVGVNGGPRNFGMWTAVTVIIVATAVLLLGWWGGIEVYRRIVDGYPAMVPATAISLIVGGLGTVALFKGLPRELALVAAGVIAGTVAIAVVAPVPFIRTDAEDGMSRATILVSLLLSADLFCRSTNRLRLASGIEILGISLVLVPLIGYIFHSDALFDNPLYTKMALHTALAHSALFAALALTEPSKGWIGIILAPELGSQMARRVLPITVIVPLMMSLLAGIAVEMDIMTVDFRLAVLTFVIIGSTTCAVLCFAHLANVAERRGSAAEAAYLRSERKRQEMILGAAQAQKVEALGQLVGGVAHDFNNTLNVILGNLELLSHDPEPEARDGYLDEAVAASHRAATLTGQLLAYGRKSRLNPKVLHLSDAIEPTLSMFKRVCPASIEVVRDPEDDDAVVLIDADAFQQALLNILINARDAMPEGGRIVLSLSNENLAAAEVEGFGGAEILSPGEYATLSVADSGTGMAPDVAERASEPFFTTKGVGEGTGLGLSTVVGFCRQSGGGLRIESLPGEGAVVTMAFPLAGPGLTPDDPPHEIAALPTVLQRGILIVDDDDAVTRVMNRQLALDGHSVRVADNAEEALRILEEGPLPELVIADIIMPGRLQGHQLAHRIGQRYPGVQVLLMSGYDSVSRREEIAALVDLPFLQKPISLRTLRAVVGRTLSGSQHDEAEVD